MIMRDLPRLRGSRRADNKKAVVRRSTSPVLERVRSRLWMARNP